VLGGVAPIPWRVPAAEQLLIGKRITPELAAQVAETALAGANPLRNNAYKVPLTKTILRRTVLELANRTA
jgi:xanthine dehydrogenase YagS FAD-binding subunit